VDTLVEYENIRRVESPPLPLDDAQSTLGQVLTRETKLSPSFVVDLALSLLRALQSLHDSGRLHGPLAPSCVVLVGPNLVELVPLRNTDQAAAAYLSPEQAGLLTCPADLRSDFYSLGILLFECLVGYPPFRDSNLSEILKQHLNAQVPDPHSLDPAIDVSLSKIVLHLLKKDPSQRYQSHQAIMKDLVVVHEGFARGAREPLAIAGLSDKRQSLADPAFVGRVAELRKLESAWALAREGKGGLLCVESESGGGKTRLLSEFTRLLPAKEKQVFCGQGLDRAAQRPFQVLVGVATQLAELAERDSEMRSFLRTKLRVHHETLSAAFPEIAVVFKKTATASVGPDTFGEIRSIRALGALLDSLGTADKPAVIILDDCQWADELTLRLIQTWSKPKPRHVLVICAYRSEEVREGHLLRSTNPLLTLQLAPLGQAEIETVVQSMAGGHIPSRVVELVSKLSEGSPFMISAVLYGLVETKTLVPGNVGWAMDERSPNLGSSEQAATLLASRFHLLSDGILQFLKVAAVLGKEFEIKVAAKLVDKTMAEIEPYLVEAQRRHLIWKRQDNRFGFVHDKLREGLLALIDAGETRRLHRLAAETIESRDTSLVFELAYHFDRAGLPEQALPYALVGAEEARKRHSLEVAETQYRIAQRGSQKGSDVCRWKVAEGLGDILMLRGRYGEAREQFDLARVYANSQLAQSHLDWRMGELYFKRGDMAAASRSQEEGLRRLGRSVPRHDGIYFVRLLWELFVQALHTFVPSYFVGKKDLPDEATRLAMRLHSRMAYSYWFERGRIPCAWAHLRGMNLAEKFRPTPELAQAYSEHSPIMTMLPDFDRGLRYAEQSVQMRRDFGDLWGEGQSLHFMGVSLYSSTRFRSCIEKCQEAVRLMEKAGDRWEVNTANWHIAYCHYRLGEMREASHLSQNVFREAIEIGDHSSAAISLSIWSKASGGRVPREEIDRALQLVRTDVHSTAELLQARAIQQLRAGEIDGAIQDLRVARETIHKKGFSQEYVAPIYPWLATALRIKLERLSPFQTHERPELLDDCLRAVREAVRNATKYPNNLPHALREQGYIEAMRGSIASALRCFERSIEIARQQDATFESALSVIAGSRALPEHYASDRKPELVRALNLIEESGARFSWLHHQPHDQSTRTDSPTLSLVDRFDRILHLGRRIITCQTQEEVILAFKDAFRILLRVEDIRLLRPDDLTATPTSSEDERLIRAAIYLGRPLGSSSTSLTHSADRYSLSRSAICAPIFIQGRARLCLLASHSQVQQLFGEEEEGLADYLATLAGAALENVETLETLTSQAKMLGDSNAQLERFAFVASHDLQEPLRALRLSSEFLSENCSSEVSPRAKEYVDYIINGARRMQTLVEDLLIHSRINSIEAHTENVDTQQIFERVRENLQASLEAGQIELKSSGLPIVQGVRPLLAQLLQNLISNAAKFRRGDHPTIEVEAKHLENAWVFSVRDNGIGFEPQYASSIFVLFKRLHSTDKYPGNGIGLATCKQIVDRHHGKIWAESIPGVGSTFYFSLPTQ